MMYVHVLISMDVKTMRTMLTDLGTVTPRFTSQVTPEGILESNARPGQDDLPILPLYYLRRAIVTSARTSFHTSLEGIKWG